MKKILLLLFLFACSGKEKDEAVVASVPQTVNEKVKFTTYEGVIHTDFGDANVEISLKEVETGMQSSFELKGSLTPNGFGLVGGEYTVLQGAANNEVILQLHGTLLTFIERNRKKGQQLPIPETHELELYFVSQGDQKLVQIDGDHDRLAEDSKYTLYKRSKLFTAEGYITFEENRADFYEQNTAEKWTVASLGKYDIVRKQYDSIATEKYEGVYLKAVAYSVLSDSSDNELFVVKHILEMNKSKAYKKAF